MTESPERSQDAAGRQERTWLKHEGFRVWTSKDTKEQDRMWSNPEADALAGLTTVAPSHLVSSDEIGRSHEPSVRRKPEWDRRSAQSRLLWIDDEISSFDPSVRFLELQSFRVDCAVTGCDGLAMARTRGYDGILLDLMLPDVPGLSVLATLRAEKVNTPVLILTGFADLESARVAGRFGASSFRAKPLFVDDLEIAVRQLIQESASGPNNLEAGDAADDELRAGFAVVARLLERLHQLARNSPPIEAGHPSVSEEGSQPFRRVATELIRALTSPALPTIAFLACSAALRKSVTADHAESLHTRAANAEALILAALAKPGLVEPRVVAAIQSLISAAAGHTRPTIELIAEGQGISASHLGRLVRDETGFDVTEWRTALNLRPGLSALVETDHDIKQIACGRLGFKHLSQFDHEFHRFFGLTPTDFRKFKLSHRS